MRPKNVIFSLILSHFITYNVTAISAATTKTAPIINPNQNILNPS